MAHGRKIWIGAAAGAVIAAASIYAVTQIMPDITWAAIVAAANQISTWRVLAAIALVMVCYALLSLYDHIALTAIGHDLPWKAKITGSITAYALSHNLGMAVITSSGARWRIYAKYGLKLSDIARIVIITGMSFWLGIIVLAGMGMLMVPQTIENILPIVGISAGQQVMGIAIIAFDLGYLLCIQRGAKSIGWRKASVPLPKIGHALMQNGLGAIEMGLTTLILLLLTPGMGINDYPILFLAYVAAFVSVLITHAPGGVGVLELVIIAMMPNYDKTNILTGLLLFRVIFHLFPLVVAVVMLALTGQKAKKVPIETEALAVS